MTIQIDRSGISPIVSTVILVAIVIVVAVSQAYWVSQVSYQYTLFERIEIVKYDVIRIETLHQFNISVHLKNTGSADATVIAFYLNGKQPEFYSASHNIPVKGLTVRPNQNAIVEIYLPSDSMDSGVTPEIKLRTANGKDYLLLVPLP